MCPYFSKAPLMSLLVVLGSNFGLSFVTNKYLITRVLYISNRRKVKISPKMKMKYIERKRMNDKPESFAYSK